MKLENKYSESVIERGEGYIDSVDDCIKINNFIYGKVQGSSTYKTEVDLDSLGGDCSCPYGTNCKHAVALYLVYQKGKFWDADGFIKSLNKMNSNELKELILSKLQDNPDWIIKHNIRKRANKKEFIKSFKKGFSLDKISEAEALLPDFSLEQLLELQDYISDNYDDLAEKLGEERENEEYGYDYWDDEGYDEELLDLNEKLMEIIVKKSLERGKVKEVIKRVNLRDEIIENAESFLAFKENVKKAFSNDEYLKFLLNLKNPDVLEIKRYVNQENKESLYELIDKKSKLIKNIANLLKDLTLIFSISIYENDFNTIINNFNQFNDALKEDYSIKEKLSDVIDLFIKNKFKNEEIAKKLLNMHIGSRYNRKQISYLASQINDYDFIRKVFRKNHIETDASLLERLAQIDQEKTLKFIKNRSDMLKQHWSNIIPLFNFLNKVYSKKDIESYIEANQDCFRTSSHLKKHLKEECGIFISQKEGRLT